MRFGQAPLTPFEGRWINRVSIGCVVILLFFVAAGVQLAVREAVDKTKARERLAADVQKCVKSGRYPWRKRYELDEHVGLYEHGYVSPEAQCLWEFARENKS